MVVHYGEKWEERWSYLAISRVSVVRLLIEATDSPGIHPLFEQSVNARLSFLRYGPGHYFKPHCDGLVDVMDSQQKSFVTLHLYLNDGDSLAGGATRFWTPNKKEYIDVEPKLGRVLVFQQRKLIHSGEEVTGGVKYTMRSDFMYEIA
jgi:hypothetical protein